MTYRTHTGQVTKRVTADFNSAVCVTLWNDGTVTAVKPNDFGFAKRYDDMPSAVTNLRENGYTVFSALVRHFEYHEVTK